MTDGIPNGLQAKWHVIGTDETGSDHAIDFVSRTIYVVTPEGRLEHVEELAAKNASVEAWMQHIARKRGWRERRYGRGFGEMLADKTEGAA